MSRERPKENKKTIATVDAGGTIVKGKASSSILGRILHSLSMAQGGHISPIFRKMTRPADPHKLFEQKREGKRGGWKKWELEKVWGPKFTPEGKLFVPDSKDSGQQKRRREEQEAYKYMTEHFGFEPRSIRRAMPRARLKNFRLAERELTGKLAG